MDPIKEALEREIAKRPLSPRERRKLADWGIIPEEIVEGETATTQPEVKPRKPADVKKSAHSLATLRRFRRSR